MSRGAKFATTGDGVRIAYVTAGAGHALFWCPHFLASHVELEWEFPQRYIYARLSKRLQVVRFDGRGLGLSDREVGDISLDARMRDLTAVADRLGLERFALAGVQGGGNLAAAYAATYPERVTHLVLLNWAPNYRDEATKERMQAMTIMLQRDWDMLTENIGGVSFGYNSPFAAGYGRLVRASATQEMALRYGHEILEEDCYPLLSSVACESLVLHSERSSYASAESARSTAAAIAHCRLREFEGDLPDHIEKVITAIGDFVAPLPEGYEAAALQAAAPATPPGERPAQRGTLTMRELEVLHLVVKGLSNREIAASLVLSPRTIERHLENLYRKTNTRNRAEAAAHAVASGLLEAPPA